MLLDPFLGDSLPRSPRVPRRQLLNRVLQAWTFSAAAMTASLLVGEWERVRSSGLVGNEWDDPLVKELRSATGAPARLERQRLERDWRTIRDAQNNGRDGRAPAEAAFATVLSVRQVLGKAEVLGRAQADDWAAGLAELITLALVEKFSHAADVLASSRVLSEEARSSIGWRWGAAPSAREVGAQADAAQAMCKLRANLGMISPFEALYYLDITKRSIDEILSLGAAEGFVARGALPSSDYLPVKTLDQILALDEVDGDICLLRESTCDSDPNSHKVLGTKLRAEKQFDLEESLLLEQDADLEIVEVDLGG